MIVYIFQNQLFQAEVENYHQDLELIKRQIIAGLKAWFVVVTAAWGKTAICSVFAGA